MSSKTNVHPTGWFSYETMAYNMVRRQGAYSQCTLLRDVRFEEDHNSVVFMPVTMHDDARCIKGAQFGLIVDTHEGQLMGWGKDETDVVLDIYY